MSRVVVDLGDVRIRELGPADAKPMAALANNRQVWLNLRDVVPHPYTVADGRAFIRSQLERERPDAFAIEAGGELAGAIGLHRASDVHRYTAELGYWLGEPYWGRGLATRCVRALTDAALAESDLLRIEAHVFSWNPASARVLEKAGFHFEGVRRASVVKDGHILDQHMWVRLRAELGDRWPG